MRIQLLLGLALLVAFTGPARLIGGAGDAAGIDDLSDVREFMAGYGRDLLAHNREGLLERYHSKGALIVVDGVNDLLPPEAIGGFYRTQWEGPKHFEWTALNYHALSADSVIVTGAFLWQAPDEEKPHRVNFSVLLVREDAGWRIRAEMEFKATSASRR